MHDTKRKEGQPTHEWKGVKSELVFVLRLNIIISALYGKGIHQSTKFPGKKFQFNHFNLDAMQTLVHHLAV